MLKDAKQHYSKHTGDYRTLSLYYRNNNTFYTKIKARDTLELIET